MAQAAADRKRQKDRERSRERAVKDQEIGPLPKVCHPKLKKKAMDDPEYYLLRYFPRRFYLPFGAPHRKAIQTLEDCIRKGELHAFAMMRGGGKTAITEPMILRANLYGFRRYTVLIGATDSLASAGVKRMKWELEHNDLLADDFPEVCHPIRCLGGITQKARGQKLDGVPTNIELKDGYMVLPTVKGSPASGSVIQAFGITGAIKGLQQLAPDGTPLRPDIVLIDDAQTRESACSPTQSAMRERVICDDILNLAGPQTNMAAVFLCTPITEDDLTERFIDPDRHPEWQGVRTQMVEAFPTHRELWDEYGEIRRESFRSGDKGRRATEYYVANREKMDAGCVLAWPERVKGGDVSGVQTAMNIYLTNPTGFASEFQCRPLKPASAVGAKELLPAAVAARVNGVERLAVPPSCSRLTAFVDCGGQVMWYVIAAWNDMFGGAVIDYGTWPRQTRSVFGSADPRPSLSDLYPGQTEQQRVHAGLMALLPQILGRPYYRAGGGQELLVERCLIDAGWLPSPVYDAIAASGSAGVCYPSKGVGRSNTAVGVARWKRREGEQSGYHWRLTLGERGRGRQVQFDPDAWKTVVYNALTVPRDGRTGLALFGTQPVAHELFAEHLASESSVPTPHLGEVFDKWSPRLEHADNHWLDCLVGTAVAASVQGLLIPTGGVPTVEVEEKPIKLSDIQKAKRKQQGGRR